MEEIRITGEFIRLDQLLKLVGAVDGGGEAKLRIQAGEARVNGDVEVRRGRKVRPGDLVEFGGADYRVAPQAVDRSGPAKD